MYLPYYFFISYGKFSGVIIPFYLKAGDQVRIVSPAGKVKKEKVFSAIQLLKNYGFEVMTGKNVLNEYFQFSGTDEQRLADLQEALDDPAVKAIFCSRGGYGIIRLISRLDFSGFRKYPKWLVGFSDVTILHCLFNNLGFATIHGVMPKLFFDEPDGKTENLESLIKILSGVRARYPVEPHPLNRHGSVTGELVGGNLSLICSLQATPAELKTHNKILFLEDTGEYLYHLDRMMQNLKLSGKLKNLKGLVVGDFSDLKDNPDPFGKSINEIIYEAISEYSYPVCFGFPAGHEKRNLALALGMKWNLSVQKEYCYCKMI